MDQFISFKMREKSMVLLQNSGSAQDSMTEYIMNEL